MGEQDYAVNPRRREKALGIGEIIDSETL